MTRTFANFWVDVASLIVMLGLLLTGGLIHYVLPAGTGHFYTLFGWDRHDIGQLHFYLAVAAIVLLGLHVVLHWDWICCVIAKMASRKVPSKKAQTMWGIGFLLLVAVVLGGVLVWASALVERTAPDGRGRGRRAQLEDSQVAPRAGNALDVTTSTAERSPAAQDVVVQPTAQQGSAVEHHADECPAGASIDGRKTLIEAAQICRLSVEQLTKELGLPPGINPGERLGRIKRSYSLDLHAVRKIACR